MKKSLFFLSFLLFFFVGSLQISYANGAGLPAFFKINNKLAISNPIQQFGITASSFLIPQDLAAENYLINKPINFQIDQTPLQSVIPLELLKTTKYSWDFGDGQKASGLTNTHTYKKSGSYILVLTINIYDNQSNSPTQFIDSFLINILPNEKYNNLPQATITLNNSKVKNGGTNLKDLNFNESVIFDASKSHSSSKIVQYLWNFGDGQTSTQPIATHKYKTDDYFHTVVLRIKNSDGYISDAFIGVRNTSGDPAEQKKHTQTAIIWTAIALALFIILVVFLIILKKKKTKKNRS